MMSCAWMLMLISHVMLLLLCSGHSRCAIFYPRVEDDTGPQFKHFEKRYDDVDYDSFIGLMGRRSAVPNRSSNSPFRSNMNDIFVGLLGRRNTIPAVPTWREERRGNFFLKHRRPSIFPREGFAVPYEA